MCFYFCLPKFWTHLKSSSKAFSRNSQECSTDNDPFKTLFKMACSVLGFRWISLLIQQQKASHNLQVNILHAASLYWSVQPHDSCKVTLTGTSGISKSCFLMYLGYTHYMMIYLHFNLLLHHYHCSSDNEFAFASSFEWQLAGAHRQCISNMF